MYYFLHLWSLDRSAAPTKIIHEKEIYVMLAWVISKMFYKEILEETAIFRVSGGTNFENFSARRQPRWRFCGIDICTVSA